MERLSVLYASALFDLAKQQDACDDFLDQALFLHEALTDEDCRRVVTHPQISEAEKRDFFNKAFAGHINRDLLSFLYLVVEKNREAYLVPALSALIGMIKRYNGKVTANVSFAAPPEESQLAEIKRILSGKLGKNVDISIKVDPALIGGPFIFVDGFYIDWTVKTRLNDLTVAIKETIH